VSFEICNKGKYGNVYWLEIEIQPLKDTANELIGFMAIENDITQRKKAEELVIMSENQLIANLDNIPNVAIQWYDEAGRVVYWNPASERLYEWTSEEAIGKTLDQLIHTLEEAAEFLSILKEIKATGQPYGPYESPVTQKNGTQKWVLATTFSIPMGRNKTGFVCMDVDITEQKNTAKALRESEEKYSSVVSAVGEGLVVQDIQDKIIMCNQSAADILGLTIDQLKGKDSYDPQWKALKEDGTLFAPEEHPTMITLKTGNPVDNVPMSVHTGNGIRKYIIINSRPVLDHNGVMYAAVASFTDITKQKTAEQDLLRTNQELIVFQNQLKQNIEELYASQSKIEEQKQHLEQEVNERKQAEEKILAQNEILREIAWHQSHTIRRPVATILGLINLINKEENATEAEKKQYLNYLLETTQELDSVIHTIVEKTNETA
jgi:PAS domain S-box-containing protein